MFHLFSESCPNSVSWDNVTLRPNLLTVTNLDVNHGLVHGDYYYPKPTLTWDITMQGVSLNNFGWCYLFIGRDI